MSNISELFKSRNSNVKYITALVIEIEDTNPQKDRIIGVCAIKYDISTMKCTAKLNTKICPDNPNVSLKTYIKSGWNNSTLVGAPKFIDVANKLRNIIGGDETAIVGYNLRNLIIPFIYNEYARCGMSVDFTNRSVIDVKDFQDETGVYFRDMKTMVSACDLFTPSDYGIDFNTLNGQAKGCVVIIEKMLTNITPADVAVIDNSGLVALRLLTDTAFNELNGTRQVVFTRGKYYNCPVTAVAKCDKQYIEWCLSERSGMPPVSRKKLKQILKPGT